MKETWLGVLGWVGKVFLFFPFKIMGNAVPASDVSPSEPFSGTN
jgi:hypothetical protein